MADIENRVTEGATEEESGPTRREFLTGVGGLGVGAVLGGALLKGVLLPDHVYAIPASEGYLLVDSKKCQGCNTCMMACSLTHHGVQSLSLARIQVKQDPFAGFPSDKSISQCRQCPYPSCVEACPTGAMHADEETGARTVDEAKCIGCERCVESCPFTPSRVQWNFEEKHAQKCDLCRDTRFWDEDGGPDGKRACEAVCPTGAISFVSAIPVQNDSGYNVNLRDETWAELGYPIDDEGKVQPGKAQGAGH